MEYLKNNIKNEELNNPDFNRIEFDAVKNSAGNNAFVMTPKQWIERTNAIGIISFSERYHSGTYAHKGYSIWILLLV